MILRIKKILNYCIVLIVLASCAKDPQISTFQSKQFVKYFGGSQVDKASSVVECADGGFALTGSMLDDNNKTRAFLIRTDRFGNELPWSPLLLGDSINSTGHSIININDNGLLIVGSTTIIANNMPNTDVLVVKINSNGDTAWQKNFGGRLNDEALCVKQTISGNFLIGGYTESNINNKGGKDAWLIMIDNNGNKIWDRTEGFSKNEMYKAIVETKLNYILVGSTELVAVDSFDRSIFFIKIDKTSTIGVPLDYNSIDWLSYKSAIKVIKVEDESLIVMKNIYNPSTNLSNIQLLKVQEDFQQVVWTKNISFSSVNEYGSNLFIRNDTIEVIGNSLNGATKQFIVTKVNQAGDPQSRNIEIGIVNQIVNDGFISTDGHLIIAGSTVINGYSKISLRKVK